MRKFYCLVLLLSVALISHAQSATGNDSIAYYLSCIKQIRDSIPPKAIEIASHAMILAVKANDASGQVQLLKIVADMDNESGDFQSAIDNYVKALKLAERNHFTREQTLIQCDLGRTYVTLQKFGLAQNYAMKALALSSLNHDSVIIAKAQNILGNVASKQEKFYEAESWYKKSLGISEDIKNYEGISIAKNNLANIFTQQKNYAAAISYYQQALKIDSAHGSSSKEFYLNNIGSVYEAMGNHKQALSYEQAALKLAEGKTKNFSTLLNIYYQLTETYSMLGDYKSALSFNRRYVQLLDTSINENSLQRVAEIQAVYENEKKQTQIDLLNKDELISAGIIRQQKLFRNELIIGFVLLSLLTHLLYRNNRVKQRSNELLAIKNQQIEMQKNEITNYSAELEKLNQIKDKLLTIISHDLRNPLSNLNQLLAWSQKGTINKEDLEIYLTTLANDVKNTSALLDNLLLWAKSQMNGIKPHYSELDLKGLVDESVNLLQPVADEKKISLQNNVNAQRKIFADIEMIKLVIRNLIGNAIKFCNLNDSIIINCFSDEKFLTVAVEDSGAGMSQEKISTLFTPEVISSIGTRGEAGTGLGLLLCKEFVSLHGGTIHVESVMGKGSRFFFMVPNRN